MQDNSNKTSPTIEPEPKYEEENPLRVDEQPESETPVTVTKPGSSSPDIIPIESEQEVTQSLTQPELTEPVTPLPQEPIKPSKKRKRLIIAGIIIGTLLLLGGIGAGLYNLWFQNPDKVLTDAAMNAIKASSVRYSATMNVVGGEDSSLDEFKVSVTGKNGASGSEVNVGLTFTNQKKRYNLTGDGLFDKEGNLFVKLKNIQPFIDLLNEGNEPIPESVSALIGKVDGSWIKFAQSDVKEISPSSSTTQSCTSALMKKLGTDRKLGEEVANVYKQNKFVTVVEKLPSENGSLGYVIEGDKTKATSFVKDFKLTELYKEMRRCDNSFVLNENDLFNDVSDSPRSRIEVWVDRWSHALTKVHIAASNSDGSADATVKPVFNEPLIVTSPTKFITLKELQTDIEAVAMEFMSADRAPESIDSIE